MKEKFMKLSMFTTEQWLPRTPEELFPFFADAKNLEELTPDWLRFKILNPPGSIREGTRIDYRLRLHGIPLRWQSEITVWDPPRRFVDVQRSGPYRTWIHEHRFEPRNGGTVIQDQVQYAPIGGELVRRLLVAPDLEKIFRFRRERLERLFGPGTHWNVAS
jgi:ligand-binding SRPBCC domain-containing protein